ncbi:MAG: bifunctional DNA primase/polymerase, partial [Candidatus Nitrosocosmicus sp.]|nr:bifunctional DNA primase/polymerase [Candidatus Nitrosocosmicus sp.]
MTVPHDIPHIREFCNFWYNKIGVNVIPFYSKTKTPLVKWKRWQNKPVALEMHEVWRKSGMYDSGIAIITGEINRGGNQGRYLNCIDLDNESAIKEFLAITSPLFHANSLIELSQLTIVEQHSDAINTKAHIYFVTEIQLKKRGRINRSVKDNNSNTEDENIPAIEIKSDSTTLVTVTPSVHKDGFPYLIKGIDNLLSLNKNQSIELETIVDKFYERYNDINSCYSDNFNSNLDDYLKKIAKELEINKEFDLHKIQEGSRNETLFDFGIFMLNYHKNSKRMQQLKDFFFRINQEICSKPLSNKEIETIWNQDLKYFDRDLVDSENNKYIKRENPGIYDQSNQEEAKLLEKIGNKNFFEFIIKTIQMTVKQENSLIRLIAYCGLSAYTKYPLNLGIMASTSEGKTYSVNEVIQYFPHQDIWMIGSMSPRVIIRNKGIQVDEDYNPIGPKVLVLKKRLATENNEEKKSELKEQLEIIINNSKVLIDLTNKVLVFLEPPHQETWDILKPVLSHDTLYIEHPYVYQTKSTGQEVKHPITKGWPACIFCSAKDESNWPMWPEIQSRFLITSPNMIKKKYSESNLLIGQRKGLPAIVQSQVIVSDEEVSIAKDCMTLLKNELLKNKDNNVWIPFQQILSESLPSEKGPDVRMVDKVFSLLVLVTKINSFNRPKLIMGSENLAISTPIDLEQVLTLTHNLTGIPTHKLEFFSQVFMSKFKSKDSPDRTIKNSGEIIEEDRIALTTTELAEQFKKVKGKPITTDNVNKTYLQELKNNGLIDEINSKIDGRRKIYYPIVDSSQFDFTATTATSPFNQEIDNYTNLNEIDNNL